MQECLVKPYCMYRFKRGICRTCKEYNKFNREKNSAAVNLGRANKRSGKKSEQKLLLHFERQGLEARLIAGSGAYKKARKDADGDLRVVIKGRERKVENKKRKEFNRLRTLLERYPILRIKKFCYVMNEETFYELVKATNPILTRNGVKIRHFTEESTLKKRVILSDIRTINVHTIADHQFGWLHNFFNQDNADIVTLDESYKEFMFCITESMFHEIVPARKA